MSRHRIPATAALALALAACATPYGPRGQLGGYEDQRVNDTTYRVQFFGNNMMDSSTARGYAFLRAAEVTLNNGFAFFRVVHEGDESQSYVSSQYGAVYKPRPVLVIKVMSRVPAGDDGDVYNATRLRDNYRQKYGL